MKRAKPALPIGYLRFPLAVAVLAMGLACDPVQADQIEMQNGDRYFGKVLSLDTNSLVLQNEILGTIPLPREKIVSIAFGVKPPLTIRRTQAQTNALAFAPALTSSNNAAAFTASMRQLAANTNLIRQVQSQLLSEAGPEANQKYNDLLSSLMSGRMDLNGLRVEAKSAADQIRAMRKDLDGDTGALLDGYLTVLDNFLNETGGAETAPAKVTGFLPKPKSQALPEEP